MDPMWKTCPACGGSGKMYVMPAVSEATVKEIATHGKLVDYVLPVICSRCAGKGQIPA